MGLSNKNYRHLIKIIYLLPYNGQNNHYDEKDYKNEKEDF